MQLDKRDVSEFLNVVCQCAVLFSFVSSACHCFTSSVLQLVRCERVSGLDSTFQSVSNTRMCLTVADVGLVGLFEVNDHMMHQSCGACVYCGATLFAANPCFAAPSFGSASSCCTSAKYWETVCVHGVYGAMSELVMAAAPQCGAVDGHCHERVCRRWTDRTDEARVWKNYPRFACGFGRSMSEMDEQKQSERQNHSPR